MPNGGLALDDVKKAEILNDFFVGMCTVDNGVCPNEPDKGPDKNCLDTVSFTVTATYKILKGIKKKNSSGPDGLPAILFNQLAAELSRPLSMIYNCLMQMGKVPNVWKKAIVTPIFKKGLSSDPKNYRPISLTCTGSKIFETAIKAALVPFLEDKKLISPNQHGFRAKHSTCLNLLECLDDWTENLDTKSNTLVAHVDFARAFDSVSLPKLIHKLHSAGITGNLLACLKSMLCDRIQQVRVGQSLSDSKAITSGVPQGSVLGPILSILFINDLTKEVVAPSTPKLYADDLKIYCPAGNEQEIRAFKESLNNVTKWAETWQLPISKEKSKWLLISNKKKDVAFESDFELAGVAFPRVK